MKNLSLIQARKSKGFTQEELAGLMNRQKTTVSNWENGYSSPTLADAFKIAKLLETDVNVIFSGLEVQDSQTNSA